MKRLYVAAVIAAVLAASCIGSLFYQRTQTSALVAGIDHLAAAYDPKHPEKAVAPTKAFLEEYDRRTALFPMFSRHNTLTDVECELVSLPVLLEKGEPLDYTATLLRCRERLCAYYRLELPLLENIL